MSSDRKLAILFSTLLLVALSLGFFQAQNFGGTVNSGTAGQIAFYSSTGGAVSGDASLTDASNTLTYSGSGGVSSPILTSTVSTGTAPLTVSSTTQVTNLNASQLIGANWTSPAALGGATPNNGSFTNAGFSTALKVGSAASGSLLCSSAAPTITSGGGTGITVTSNGTCSFAINVGTSTITNPIVLGLATAAHGWHVNCDDVTSARSATLFMTAQTASGTASATITQLTNAAATTTPWTASDILECTAFAN